MTWIDRDRRPAAAVTYGFTEKLNQPPIAYDDKPKCGDAGETGNILPDETEQQDEMEQQDKDTSAENVMFANNTEVNEEVSERAISPSNSSESSDNMSMKSDQSGEESLYSTMEDCTRGLRLDVTDNLKSLSLSTASVQSENISSYEIDTTEKEDFSISPYACFYGPLLNKAGWLEKLSPHRTSMFQKRWVKVDGQTLSYYYNDKDVFSKGKIYLTAITKLDIMGENKFEIVTSQRTFVFRVEKDGDRWNWISTMQNALKSKQKKHPSLNLSEKNGYLELKGYKNKIFTLLSESKLWISKSKQCDDKKRDATKNNNVGHPAAHLCSAWLLVLCSYNTCRNVLEKVVNVEEKHSRKEKKTSGLGHKPGREVHLCAAKTKTAALQDASPFVKAVPPTSHLGSPPRH
ncbi:Hypothetical predicted protein [Pelobates cultripes]|uniref:PH domain-containing protein n=1 Tax=Pelobates cultripes TaxID=61616 RepID=A0AAD1WDA8_PELCU|nr:Hypothetical predicted protein [Pelobates cultripes]